MTKDSAPLPLRALVVGAGIAGERHALAQAKLGVPTLVYDTQSTKAEKVADQHPHISVVSSINEAVDKGANIMHVCTPDDLHTDPALQGIQTGMAVLLEKPLTAYLSDTLQIVDAARQRDQETPDPLGPRVWVAHNYRLHRPFAKIKEGINNDDIGRLTTIVADYTHRVEPFLADDVTPWRRRQDFLTGADHPTDLALWYADERVTSVQATVDRRRTIPDYEQPEAYDLRLQFESGLNAQIHLDARNDNGFHGSNVLVVGDSGSYRAHSRRDVLEVQTGRRSWQSQEQPHVWTVDEEVKLVDDYLLGSTNDHNPLPDIYGAVDLMYVLHAAKESSETANSRAVQVGYQY